MLSLVALRNQFVLLLTIRGRFCDVHSAFSKGHDPEMIINLLKQSNGYKTFLSEDFQMSPSELMQVALEGFMKNQKASSGVGFVFDAAHPFLGNALELLNI